MNFWFLSFVIGVMGLILDYKCIVGLIVFDFKVSSVKVLFFWFWVGEDIVNLNFLWCIDD